MLLKTDVAKVPRSWSADGRFIVYDSDGEKTSSDIWVLPLVGDRPSTRSTSSGSTVSPVEPSTSSGRPEPAEGRKPIPFLTTPANEGQGELSPDGRWMVYTSNESGRYDIYVQPFPATGGKWLVSTGGGAEPHWRRDGKELYYLSAVPLKLMAVDVNTHGSLFEASVPHALFDVTGILGTVPGAGTPTGGYVASADGQKFLVAREPPGQASRPLTIVLNWTAGLKK